MGRDIKDLSPELQVKAKALVDACNQSGIKIVITQTLRTFEEQDELYAQGRTKPGKIVTKAKGGDSFHNYGLAFDFVPLDSKGKADWNDTQKFQRVGELGESIGLEWGGRWKFKDLPHFQLTNGVSIKQLKDGLAKK